MHIHDLLEAIPQDTGMRVHRIAQRTQQRIRRLLTDDVLRWRLRHRGRGPSQDATIQLNTDKTGRNERYALPEPLRDRFIPAGHEAAALLALYRPATRRLKVGASDLGELFRGGLLFAYAPDTMWTGRDEAIETLDRARDLATRLESMALPPAGADALFDLTRFILDVDADVLGDYRYDGREGHQNRSPTPSGQVTLYWGAIGLVAQSLDVTIEHLTVVTLAHELAHGYTHLGVDRDGQRWLGSDFATTEDALAECLAQYYTHLLCERLDPDLPGLLDTYHHLLSQQSVLYQLHLPLLLESTPERVASNAARLRNRPASYTALLHRLDIEPERLGFSSAQVASMQDAVREMRVFGG